MTEMPLRARGGSMMPLTERTDSVVPTALATECVGQRADCMLKNRSFRVCGVGVGSSHADKARNRDHLDEQDDAETRSSRASLRVCTKVKALLFARKPTSPLEG